MIELCGTVSVSVQALVETSDREIFERLTSIVTEDNSEGRESLDAPANTTATLGTSMVHERALMILEQPRKKNLFTRAQCLAHLGENFRAVMEVPERRSNAWVRQGMAPVTCSV